MTLVRCYAEYIDVAVGCQKTDVGLLDTGRDVLIFVMLSIGRSRKLRNGAVTLAMLFCRQTPEQ